MSPPDPSGGGGLEYDDGKRETVVSRAELSADPVAESVTCAVPIAMSPPDSPHRPGRT